MGGIIMKAIIKFLMWALFGKKENDNNLVAFINSGIALPDKLDTIDEEECVDKLISGDEDAKIKLIEHNLRLVVYTAQKFENTGVSIDDLISIGTVGLIKAVGSFNKEKNIKVATYASRCIENEILMYLRKNQKTKKDLSLDNPINTDSEGNELLLADVVGTGEDVLFKGVENELENSLLKQAIGELSIRERDIVNMRFGLNGEEEMTQKEVADSLNISQSYISRLEKKILDRMKKRISREMSA